MPAEGRGLSSRQTQDVARDRGLGNLSTPKSVQKLQMALHAKAKAEAGYRLYALYDKISREDILAHAYAQCRSNRGAPGVDGQDFADIERMGLSGGSANWRLRLRRRLTNRIQSDACSYRGQRQTQAAGPLDLARSGLHDSSNAGAGTDFRSRSSARAICLSTWAQRPAGGGEVEELVFRGYPEL